jgi:hypothetical protein
LRVGQRHPSRDSHSCLLSAFRLGVFLSGTPFQNAQRICLEISPIELEIRIRYTARFVPPMPRLVKITLREKRTVPNGASKMLLSCSILRPFRAHRPGVAGLPGQNPGLSPTGPSASGRRIIKKSLILVPFGTVTAFPSGSSCFGIAAFAQTLNRPGATNHATRTSFPDCSCT